MASARFRESGSDIEEMVKLAFTDEGTKMDRSVDEYGYEWLKLTDDDFDDLFTTIHVAAQSIVAPSWKIAIGHVGSPAMSASSGAGRSGPPCR